MRSNVSHTAAEMPELMVPVRTTNSQDLKVHPASALNVSIPVPTSPKVPISGTKSQVAFSDLVEAYRTGQPEQWTRAESAIHSCGLEALPTLLDNLQSPDGQIRELASMMLSQVMPDLLYPEDPSQRPEVAPIAERLRIALGDESVEVRVNVAVAMSLIEGEGPRLVPIFQELLNSELPHVRTMSVVALGGLTPHAVPAIPAIQRMSQSDPDPNTRSAAVEALQLLQSQP
ncbi:MAG: HEAT repeat domain-containing protein [Planctomycetaceae bacterium]|nr:HEAT repeat domain-containing protein [Planctomycetaceae bacterium]